MQLLQIFTVDFFTKIWYRPELEGTLLSHPFYRTA